MHWFSSSGVCVILFDSAEIKISLADTRCPGDALQAAFQLPRTLFQAYLSATSLHLPSRNSSSSLHRSPPSQAPWQQPPILQRPHRSPQLRKVLPSSAPGCPAPGRQTAHQSPFRPLLLCRRHPHSSLKHLRCVCLKITTQIFEVSVPLLLEWECFCDPKNDIKVPLQENWQ